MPVLAMAKQLHVSRSVLLPAVVGINAKQEQPNSKLLHLVVGAGMLTVLSQNSYDYSESVGKKRKKDSGRPEGLPHLAKMLYDPTWVVTRVKAVTRLVQTSSAPSSASLVAGY